ncbi:MAG: hypothetical protein ACREBS_01100 [Nitrososphaerales archaeon]
MQTLGSIFAVRVKGLSSTKLKHSSPNSKTNECEAIPRFLSTLCDARSMTVEEEGSVLSDESIRDFFKHVVVLSLDEVRLTKLVSETKFLFDAIQPVEELETGAEDEELKGISQ